MSGNRNRALGYKDGSGNYGFVMYASGSIKIGNDGTDVIAMTGSQEIIGRIKGMPPTAYNTSTTLYRESFDGLTADLVSPGNPSSNGTWTNGAGSKTGQTIANGYEWQTSDGGTPSGTTGPTGPHSGSNYVFAEASAAQTANNDGSNVFYVMQRSFTAAEASEIGKMSFYYHMHGDDMGSLHISASTDGSSWTGMTITKDADGSPSAVSSISGEQQANQGDAWKRGEVDLTSYLGSALHIRINGYTTGGYRSDLAIDAIEFTPAPYALYSTAPVSASAYYGKGNGLEFDDAYVDVIRRKTDSSTTTKIRLMDEEVRVHCGNANDEVLKLESGTATIAGDLVLDQYIYHNGDTNTLINFADDKIILKAGGKAMVTMEEKGSAPHEVTINDGGNNVDFVVKGNGSNQGNPLFICDASTGRVGINGVGSPAHELDVDGTIVSTGLTVDTDTLHVDSSNNRVGIGTTTPAANLSIEGDADGGTVSLRLGADAAAASNFSARLEFAEDTDDSQVMNYGAFMDYDGDAASGFGNGMLNVGMRNNSTSDTNIFRIDRDAAADSLHINDSGVAVGTQLHVTKNATVGDIGSLTLANAGVKITDSSTNMHIDGNSINTDGNTYLNVSANYDLYFGTNNTERMRIKNDGKIGIGTDSPQVDLQIDNSSGGRLTLVRSDATTTLGDELGRIGWDTTDGGIDGGDPAAYIVATAGETMGSSDKGANMYFYTKPDNTDYNVAGTLRMGIVDSGRVYVGIDYQTDEGMLQVKQGADAANLGGLSIIQSGNDDTWTLWHSTAENLNFSFNGSSKGYLDDGADVNNITFTGQHRCTPSDSTSYTSLSSSVGKIVISDGTYSNLTPANSNISINEAIPKVKLATARNQKSVFGVVSDSEDENEATRTYKHGIYTTIMEKSDSSDNRLYINSLGEGGVWISNINGNLENGDYITTCEIPGYGMKQDDDLLHNYTVAKITQDCDFDLNSSSYECVEISHDGSTYRAAFVGCTYHCG
jgi:hypothetical protein